MNQENSLRSVEVWQKELGLLPIPLYPGNSEGLPVVLLNGARGNFCLDIYAEKQDDESRSIAWSSNVSHYVTVVKDYVEVQRWDQSKSSLSRYSTSSVKDNLEKFHEYLEKDAPNQDLSIISHAIRIFRSLRTILGNEHTGSEALKAFLYLLACTKDRVNRDNLVLTDWSLDAQASEVASVISDDNWELLRNELLYGRRIESLELNLTLLLRHAAGQLFQEAHYEAVFAPQFQLSFAGFTPTPVSLDKENTSIGLHFTPPALARSLVEEALETVNSTLIIFDPACGSGEFLRESLRQIELRSYKGCVKLIGWDISLAACDMARFVLAWEKRNIETEVEVEVRCVDSLNPNEPWPKSVTNLFMNPPFVSWQDMTSRQREAVAEVLQEVKEKRSDLSHAFLFKASICLAEGGVLGAIVPSSFLDGESAQKLRQRLSLYVSPRLLARLGSQFLFPGAVIDAAFYVAQNLKDSHRETVAFWADHRPSSNSAGLRALRKIRSSNSSSAYPLLGDGFSIYKAQFSKSGGSWSPRPYSAWLVLRSLSNVPRVQDMFDITQGARTGFVSGFVLKKKEWLALPRVERSYFRAAVVNRSIHSGEITDDFYIFFPYGDKGVDTEADLQKLLPLYYRSHLLPAKDRLINRVSAKTEKWWHLSRHRSWQTSRVPKIVSTYFGDAGSFAYDSTGEYVVVQGHAWLPKPSWMARRLKEGNDLLIRHLSETATLPETPAYAYLAVINSKLFSTLLSASSNSVGGGQWNLSKKLVDNVALPDLLDEQGRPELISDLAKIGRQISDGIYTDTDKQEELVKIVYGLSREA